MADGVSMRRLKQEPEARAALPYARHVTDEIVALDSGALMIGLKLDGVSFETADARDLNDWHVKLNQAWRNLADDRLAVWHHVVRRPIALRPATGHASAFARELSVDYDARLAAGRLFVNELYVSLVLHPGREAGERAGALMRRLRAARRGGAEIDAALLRRLEDAARDLVQFLGRYGPRCLGLYERRGLWFSEPLEMVRLILTGRAERVPLTCGHLGDAAYAARVIFGREALELRDVAETRFAGVLAIKEYPSVTRPGLWDGLLDARFPFVVAQSFAFLSALKKKQRDRASSVAYSDAVAEELGDVLWYLAAIARRGGLSLSAIAAHLYRKDGQWLNKDDPALTFEALQPHTIVRTAAPLPQFEETLLALAAEVGAMVADHQNAALVPGGEALARRLTNVFRLLLKASREAGLTLEGAAVKNRHKILGRWPEEKIYPAAPDADKDYDEQLPRQMAIEIFEKSVGDRPFVFQRCNELFIGDRLTDNAHEADDYRFHDVFHYAFVAVLGWSPVVRSLLRLKRKSDAKLDETEDGARAILIEEGISTWVFSMARPLDYFRGMKAGELPLDLLKQVHQFVQGYEPQDYPLWLWEEAILQGYAAFRFLQEHRRGLVTIDFGNRQLRIEPLAS